MDSNGALNLASTSPSPTDFSTTSLVTASSSPAVSLVASADTSGANSSPSNRRSPPNFAQRAAGSGNFGGVELCVVCGDRASGEFLPYYFPSVFSSLLPFCRRRRRFHPVVFWCDHGRVTLHVRVIVAIKVLPPLVGVCATCGRGAEGGTSLHGFVSSSLAGHVFCLSRSGSTQDRHQLWFAESHSSGRQRAAAAANDFDDGSPSFRKTGGRRRSFTAFSGWSYLRGVN